MTADRWVQLLAIAVAVLGIAVTVILRRSDRAHAESALIVAGLKAEAKTLQESNQTLRDTNVDLKIQLMGLQRVGQVVDRTFSGLVPDEPRKGGTS